MDNKQEAEFKAGFDIKVEAVAAALLHQDSNLSLDQFVVSPQGSIRRRSSHEIKEVRKKVYPNDEVVWLLEVFRKGFADTLPENLFLSLEEDYPDPVAKAKALGRQLTEARKFFLPFEQSTYLPRIETEMVEQRWTESFPKFIEAIWGLQRLEDLLSQSQRFLLCYLLPEAHRIIGDWKLTRLCFEAVISKKVEIDSIAPLEYEIPDAENLLGDLELGDIVVGNRFRDDLPALQIKIWGVSLDDLPDYLPGGRMRRVLEDFLYSYLLPLDHSVVTKIEMMEVDAGFETGKAYLGFNSALRE